MTIQEYAAAQGLPDITRHTLPNGSHVYRLQDKNDDGKIGLPFFAYETADGWQAADPDQTIKIMNAIYGDDE